jgi:phosphoglycerate dehydrogenase-like enzyme
MKIVATLFNRVFSAWVMPDWCVDEVRRVFPDIEFVKLEGTDGLLDQVRDADIIFAARMTEESFRAASKLKWIHAPMAGLDYVLIPSVIDSDVLVSNSRGVHAEPMAEHAIGFMLMFARRLHDCLDAQRAGRWRRDEIYQKVPTFDELAGKTVGVLGFGAIGTEVAKRARAFGMRVVGFKRDISQRVEHADALHTPDRLEACLPDIDYLVIAVPGMRETNGMIGRAQLDLMKPTSVLINLSRGSIVDQDALVDALESEQIAGAGLDVFTPEPLPDGHPLYKTRNLILTPHISGTSPMLWRRTIDLFIENVHRFRDGRELINLVDKTRGY